MTRRPQTAQGISSAPTRPSLIRSQSDSNPSLPNLQDFEQAPAVRAKPNNPSAVLVKKRHSTFVPAPELMAVSTNGVATPQRPPRNPARAPADSPPVQRQKAKSNRPKTATGTREEVTPWELYPAPDYTDTPVSQLPSTNVRTSTRPTPPVTGTNTGGLHLSDLGIVRRRKSTGSKPQPKNAGISASQILLARPAVPSQTHSTLDPTQPSSKSAPETPKLLPKATALAPAPLSPFIPSPQSHRQSSTQAPGSSSAVAIHRPLPLAEPRKNQKLPNLKFSTADRTILEELKRNISARAAQFVFKGGPTISRENSLSLSAWGAQGIGAGKKHHPYSKEEVPYPRNYERDVLDLDVWENVFCQQISGSLTYHVFDHPPARVLDLGCGTGTWVLNCARAWRHSSFVGLDIVPLHPDLQQVGSSDLAARVTWVQANFLDGLPFPNEEFDFVHVKRISLGVPEDKWDALFEEITRVMKPGAAFEMIEEDLFFPGKSPDDDENDADVGSETRSSGEFPRYKLHRQSLPSSAFDHVARNLERMNHDQDRDSDSLTGSGSGDSHRASSSIGHHSDEIIWSPTTSVATGSSPIAPHPPALPPATPPRSNSPLPPSTVDRIVEDAIAEDVEGEKVDAGTVTTAAEPKTLPRSPSMVNLRDRAAPATPVAVRPPPPPPLRVHVASPMQRASAFHLPSKPSQGKFSGSAEWMIASLAPTSGQTGHKISFDKASTSTLVSSPHSPISLSTTRKAPFLLRSLPKAPSNPRDHSLLALIYTEMCESRFINLSPLSLLANLLGLHFYDVRTHPPLQFTFPPRPKPSVDTSDSDPDDEARDAIIPNPSKPPSDVASTPRASASNSSSYFTIPADDDVDEEARFLSVRGLIKGTSQYVTLDDSRVSAFSPSKKASFPSPATKFFDSETAHSVPANEPPMTNGTVPGTVKARAISMRQNRLPNATMNMDLRTLNLHLAIRTSEILACSESMWEWVVAHQNEVRAQKEQRAKFTQRARSGSVETALHQKRHGSRFAPAAAEPPSLKSAIYELTREDFDGLLNRFATDMRDNMSLGPALQERLSWSTFPSSPTAERRMFDNEFSQWLQWDQEQRDRQPRRRPQSMVGSASTLSDGSENKTSVETNRRPSDTSHHRRTLKQNSSVTKSASSLIPPTRRLSRAMRVFVGWKPLTS